MPEFPHNDPVTDPVRLAEDESLPDIPDIPTTLRTALNAVKAEITSLRLQKARIAPRLRDLLDEERRLTRALRPYQDRRDESDAGPTAGT